MRWLHGGAMMMMMMMCVIGTGCDVSTTPGNPTAGEIPVSESSSGVPAPTTGAPQLPPETQGGTKPGVPGSPIDYDSTIGGGLRTIDRVRGYIESQLEEACKESKVKRCGIKVVPKGKEDCVGDVFPNPVHPGATVTMVTEPCQRETPEPTDEPVPSNSTPPTDEPTPTSHS